MKKVNPKACILYQTADRFVNEFIHAIRFDKIHQFHAKYKDVDVLLIDDIQFISNKDFPFNFRVPFGLSKPKREPCPPAKIITPGFIF